jgi:catechol 2,3-dioxygenase-like lactoylglutathione lyase family enzyme
MPLPYACVNELVLEVTDLAAAEEFYTTVLDMPVIDRWDPPREATWVLAGATRIGLWTPQMGISRGRGGLRVHYALSVDESGYDQVVAHVRSHGHQVDEVEWADGAARSAYVTDPDANVVEFWTWDVARGSAGPATAATAGTYALSGLPPMPSRR